MKNIRRFISALLVLTLTLTGCFGLNVAAATEDNAQIVSADMSLESAKNNVQQYYSNDVWAAEYPEGLYVIEYNSYEITEGGPDSENPEDIYLGVVVYRIGGNNLSATLTYNLITISGDNEMYPDCMGELDFAPQQVTATAKIKIPNDSKRNGNQLVMMTLTNATSGAISDASTTVIKIYDDEPYVESVLTMVADSVVTDKSQCGVTFTVKRSENDTDYCTAVIKTSDGTAKAGVDYEAYEEEIVFSAGVTKQKVTIPLIQSDEKFTEPKHFTVAMSDIRGGVAGGADSLRLDITNQLKEGKNIVINVDGAAADMNVDESSVLSSNMNSVLNENDTLKRTDMLKAAIGAANGKAVSLLAQVGAFQETEVIGSTSYWTDTLVITPGEFTQLYSSGDTWKPDKEFTDADEDLLVASSKEYNLNLFDAIVYSCLSRDKDGLGALSGNPNTAFGYLDSKGHSYSDSNLGSSPESDLSNAGESDLNWMKNNDIYILSNKVQTNVDWTSTPMAFELENGGSRYPKTTGLEGSAIRPFYFVYNVKGQDDNHFKINSTQLKRGVIPFTVFSGNADYEVNNGVVTFIKDSYKWKIQVDSVSKEGGFTDSGFYAGSTLRITFEPAEQGASIPVPTILYLKDSEGNIHNFSKTESKSDSESSFLVTLETNMSSDTNELKDTYLITQQEAEAHNALLTDGKCINSVFDGKLTIDCQYEIQQGVEINYKNISHVYENLSNVSEKVQKESIIAELDGVVKFYKGGAEVNPEPDVNLSKYTLQYGITDFDKIIVNPLEAGDGIKATSNLYSVEYKTITDKTEIERFVCAQVSNTVTFTLSYLESEYVDPQISLVSTSVCHNTDGKFDTVYQANYIDDSIPFEALFNDTDQEPKIAYYCMNFVISDIYVGSDTDSLAVKDYPVTVYSGDVDSQNTKKLFTFTYHGGASFAQAKNLSLQVEDGVFNDSFLPQVELLSYSSNGYEYRMYIPTYYNYQNPNDVTYPRVIGGGQGVTIEISDFDNGDEASHRDIVDYMDPYSTQYVCQKLPDIEGVSPEENASGMYFEQQEDFYTYTDHVIKANTSPVNLDLTGLATLISKFFAFNGNKEAARKALHAAGHGAYIKFWDNQMSIGVRIGYNTNNKAPKPTVPKDNEDVTTPTEPADIVDNDLRAEDIVDIEMPIIDPVANNTSFKDKVKNAPATLNAAYTSLVFNLLFEGKVDLSYNTVRNEWDFSAFTASATGGFSFSKAAPIPALANLVYASFSVKGSVTLSTGFSAIKDYVDLDGNVNYAFSFNGVTLTPNLAVSVGAGVGLSGVLALEAGGSAEFSASVTFARQKVTPKLAEADLDTNTNDDNKLFTDTYVGNWKTCVVANTADDEYLSDGINSYFYNNTYVISEQQNDTVTIEGEGTAFQLVGVTKFDGGKIKVTVYVGDSTTPVQEPQILSLESEKTTTHVSLFEWKMEDFDDPSKATPQKIKVVVENAGGKVILDSAKIFKEGNRQEIWTPASFDAASVRLSFYVKATLAFVTLALEPAYMLIKYSNIGSKTQASITLGTVYYSKTWDVSGANRMLSSTNEDLPVVVLGANGIRSTEEVNYFDTGEFAAEKTKTLLQGDIDRSSKTQVINYNGENYTFYTLLATDSETSECRYEIYCDTPADGTVLVSDDVYVGDFNAYIDHNSKLCVEYTASDSTVMSAHETDENTVVFSLSSGEKIEIADSSKLNEVLQRMCVKIATLGSNGTFSSKVINSTDGNGYQESLPVSVAAKEKSVAFFVEDEAEYNADFSLGWDGFDENSSAVQDVEGLMNAMFTGQARIRYAVDNGSGFAEPQVISVAESLKTRFGSDILTGIRVTDIDASTSQDNKVCLAYSIELPDASMGAHKGTLKEIHYREGVFAEDGTLSFSDALVIDSVFDYDEKLQDVLTADELTSKYYNAATDEYYESSILRNVQVENAVLCDNAEDISDTDPEPCVFYQTNSSINCVSYSTLSEAIKAKSDKADEKFNVTVLHSGFFNDYIIAVSEIGEINLIYKENTETSAYTDTLNIIDYDAENMVWNRQRQLTYSDVFDADALNDRQTTYGMTIDNLSAFVDAKGNVAVAFKSTYAPFTYEYGVSADQLEEDNAPVNAVNDLDGVYVTENGEEIEYMIAPMLDFESDKARSDIYMISFKDRVTAVDVSGFDMLNKVFAPGEIISLDFDIKNTGDSIIHDLYLSLYICDEDRQISNLVASKVLSGSGEGDDSFKNGLLAGDSIEQYFSFTLDDIQNNNSLLCLRIRDENDNVLFDSYESYLANTNSSQDDDKEVTYHVINNCVELGFNGIDVDVDANGKMTFSTDISNSGTVNMSKSAKVYFKVYTEDEDGNQKSKTLFSFAQAPLAAGKSEVYTDSYLVSDYLQNGELKYSFDISYDERQFDTDNDSTGVVTCYQTPEITIDSATVSSNRNQLLFAGNIHSGVKMNLGDEFELESDVVSDVYGNIHLAAYEIGSDCLSIDNSSTDGKIRVKAVEIPKDGKVKLLLSIKDTIVYRVFYLYISDKDTLNFDADVKSEGFAASDKVYMYAKNSDVFVSDKDKSTFTFDFYGEDLSVYGDLLTNGGDLKLTVTDENGKKVISEKISTASELKDFGVLLYKSEKLVLGKYTVKVEALLDEGEIVSLDYARFTIDVSDADTAPYASIGRADEVLDAPLVTGRSRKAYFNLTFSNSIELMDEVKYEDITLEFDEYEYTDGEYIHTGNTVTFIAEEIRDGNVLVFSTELQSKQGTILKYILSDSHIPDDCIVTKKGTAVNTAIPDYDKVSYVLKESGILSVTVAEDKEMPDGSVQKSVKVKFMTTPDLSRLEGTELLYKTINSEGQEETVEFKYCKMTNDPRVAVYRADALKLEKDEMSKTFSFSEGIVLGEDSYVLVTAEGDYLDNNISQVITDKTQLNITYNKLKTTASAISVITDITENDFESTPALYVDFENKVDVSALTGRAKAFVTLSAKITDNITGNAQQQEITLYADSLSDDAKTLCFKAPESTKLEKDKTVSYTLAENTISYTDAESAILSAYDKIEVNPALEPCKALTFNTSAYIASANLFFDSESFKPRDNGLGAEVVFSGAVDEATLENTSLKVTETALEYDCTRNKELVLSFESAELKGEGENAYTVAIYKYISDTDDISFTAEQYSKTFTVSAQLTFDEEYPVKSADSKEVYSSEILNRNRLSVSKLQAESALLKLIENGTNGYKVGMDLTFAEDISAVVTNEVYAVVDMTVDDSSTPMYLSLDSVKGNTLSFVCDTPISLRSGDITTFTLRNRFVSPATYVTDASGIPVSQLVEGTTELVVDTSQKGVAEKAELVLDSAKQDKLTVSAKVTFDENLNANSFEGAQVKSVQVIYYADGSQTSVEARLLFAELSDGKTAVFTAELTVPKEAVGTEIILGDTITPSKGSFVYNINRTLILSTNVPETKDLEIDKVSAKKTAFATVEDKEKIDTIEDVEIHIVYPEEITAKTLEGITLEADVRGIKGITGVLFKAVKIIEDNTLVLVPAEEVTGDYASILTVGVKNDKLMLSEGSELYSKNSGISVSTAVKDAETAFLTVYEAEVTLPPYAEPSTQSTTEVLATFESTEVSKTLTEDTTAEFVEDSADSQQQGGSYLDTGVNPRMLMIVALAMLTAVFVIILLKKKKV